MKNIKLFEQFNSEESKVSISIKVVAENPDAKWDFEVTGVGNDKKEAAILALGAACGVNSGSLMDDKVIDFREAMEYLEDYDEDGLDLLLNDSLPKDYFSDHGTTSECNVVTGNSNNEIGGYVNYSNFENY